MSRMMVSGAAGFLFFTYALGSLAAETLQDTLQAANVPTQAFAASELSRKITSYAISNDDPFLLAYYIDDGSGLIRPPLDVIRYDRATGDLQRAGLRDITALFQREIPMSCLGSALSIREYRDTIYIDTHANPSAGCVIVLSSRLSFKAALSGWLLGLLGADYAILRGSEVHFMSVHPMHIEVFDLKRNHLVEVYPFENDAQRRQFSRLIQPHVSEKWCMEHNAQCDPENFDTNLKGQLVVNEAARVFGFEAKFDAAGFGDAAEKQVPPRTVAYIFRERNGTWDHRELESLFGGMSVQELISQKPNLAFEPQSGK
ncbi:MAG: hypothetical protein LAP39_26975 [Acidobacteriia bacterium]|nr:hypothetical protein [Terriglobia bacterium]